MTYEELVKRLRDRAERFDYDGWVDTAIVLEQAADAIEKLQRVKVKPIRHYLHFCNSDGEVVRTVPDGWECPVCHSTGVDNYCPHCGAKMEDKDDE